MEDSDSLPPKERGNPAASPDDKTIPSPESGFVNPTEDSTTSSEIGGASENAKLEGPSEETSLILRELHRGLSRLQAAFDDKLKYDDGREKVIDRLHNELQEYRDDLFFQFLKPTVLDLIKLYDDLEKRIATDSADNETTRGAIALLQDFQQDIEDVLFRSGVEPFTATQPTFDPRRQRVVAPVTTDDPSLDRTIAERVRIGFRYDERIVRPEMVKVYVYRGGDATHSSESPNG